MVRPKEETVWYLQLDDRSGDQLILEQNCGFFVRQEWRTIRELSSTFDLIRRCRFFWKYTEARIDEMEAPETEKMKESVVECWKLEVSNFKIPQ